MMDKLIQHFTVAKLLFVSNASSDINLNKTDIEKIKERFQNIAMQYENSRTSDFSNKLVKLGGSMLPCNAMSVISSKNYLLLHFETSYSEPLFLIIDTATKRVRNYIEMETAKSFLIDRIYEHVQDEIRYPRNLNHSFSHISDINNFIELYQERLEMHRNPNTPTGYDCFECSVDDFDIGDE